MRVYWVSYDTPWNKDKTKLKSTAGPWRRRKKAKKQMQLIPDALNPVLLVETCIITECKE